MNSSRFVLTAVLAVIGFICLVPLTAFGILQFIPRPEPADCVKFVADITVPDGTVLRAGEQVRKTWRLRNCGHKTWTNRKLALRYGGSPEEFRAQGRRLRNAVVAVEVVPELKPDEEGDVSFTLLVPEIPGNYGLWFDIARAGEEKDIFWVSWKVSP